MKTKKDNKTKLIQMRVRPDLKNKIREEARKRKLSMSEVIERAVEYWLINRP